ncbi:MAG: ferredoxin [Pseudomonadota bacterium]
MADITFRSPVNQRDRTIYAVIGNTKTTLAHSDEHQISTPSECLDGRWGLHRIEVTALDDKTPMGMSRTEKENARLKVLLVRTDAEIEEAENSDLPPRLRLARRFSARSEDVRVSFTGTTGGSA